MLFPDYAWLIFYITFVVLAITIISLVFIYNVKKTNKEIEMTRYKVHVENINADSTEVIQTILDNFINECIDDYLVMHPEMADKHFITEEEEIKFRQSIGNMAAMRMSDALYNKLSTYYNAYTISSIIAEKIYIRITHFVVSNNAGID